MTTQILQNECVNKTAMIDIRGRDARKFDSKNDPLFFVSEQKG